MYNSKNKIAQRSQPAQARRNLNNNSSYNNNNNNNNNNNHHQIIHNLYNNYLAGQLQ